MAPLGTIRAWVVIFRVESIIEKEASIINRFEYNKK